jgi:hypothetical protein
VDANFDMKTGVRDQVDAMGVMEYFKYLAKLMKTNPPADADAPIPSGAAWRCGLSGPVRSSGCSGTSSMASRIGSPSARIPA